jgi:hypothetical protein
MNPLRNQPLLGVLTAAVLAGSALAQPAAESDPSRWSDAAKEQFLLTAKVVRTRGVSTGITGTRRATLDDGKVTHDASVQTVNISKPSFQTATGTELNFRDSYKYNIAAYRVDRVLGLNMVPVSVERRVGRETGAVTWWVDNVQMMEKDRYQKKVEPPDRDAWNDQMYQVRVFNELVYNTDPNLGNLLITEDWTLRMIDFTRAFRLYRELRAPENLENCRLDRRLYNGLRGLSEEVLSQRLESILSSPEIRAVVARRDRIAAHFDREIRARGEQAVICDEPGH